MKKRNEEDSKNETKDYRTEGMSLEICFGVSIGTIIGNKVNDVAIFMCIGLSIGMCLGVTIGSLIKKK